MIKTILYLLFFFCLIYAADIVSIRDFKGMVSNADLEDNKDEEAALLINLAPYNGKLKMTAGHGRFAAADSSHQIKGKVRGLVTYLDSHMGWDEVADSGHAYLAYVLNSSNQPIIWLHDSLRWDTLDVTGGYLKSAVPTVTHKNACNPIIQIDNTMRFLPGNVGNGEGIWIGRIARTCFDSLYKPDTGYYAYKTTVDTYSLANNIDSLISIVGDSNTYLLNNYKISVTMDATQEGLLSSRYIYPVTTNTDGSKWPLFWIKYPKTYNNRITALNVYRSYYSNTIGDDNYYRIATIDMNTTENDRGVRKYLETAYSGKYYALVPDLKNYNFDFETYNYTLQTPSDFYNITDDVSGYGNQLLELNAEVVGYDEWDVNWQLCYDQIGYPQVGYGSSNGGAFCTYHQNIYKETISQIIPENSYYRCLVPNRAGNEKNRIITNCCVSDSYFSLRFGDTLSQGFYYRADSFKVYTTITGTYYFDTLDADTMLIKYADTKNPNDTTHYLAGEISIRVNGKYAIIASGRLWQGNVVLINGSTYEYRTNGVTYSEENQYDINPVSNYLPMAGDVVGMEKLYGNVVVLCQDQIQIINTGTGTDPTDWRITESIHNIGSCAPKGHGVFRGNLFVTAREGIYMLKPNNLAEADRTPTLNLLITDPIQDVFDSNAYPESTVISYNAYMEEVMFKLYGANEPTLCYNITNGQWRELRSKQLTPLIASVDENNDPIWYCSDSVIYHLDASKKDTVTTWKSKVYNVNRENPFLLKNAYITYMAYACSLRLRTFEENATTPADTFYFPAATVPTTTKKYLDNTRAKKIQFEFTRWPDKSDTAYIEIHKVEIDQ